MYIVENDNPILHSTDTYMEREELNKFCKEEKGSCIYIYGVRARAYVYLSTLCWCSSICVVPAMVMYNVEWKCANYDEARYYIPYICTWS